MFGLEKLRKYEDINKEAQDVFGSEQEWGLEGAQLTSHKSLQATDGSETKLQTTVIQSLALNNAQQSQFSLAIANSHKDGQLMGRIDPQGVVGVISHSFGPVEALLQWNKQGANPAGMVLCGDGRLPMDDGGMFSARFQKGNDFSVQYLKSFGKRYALGCEVKHILPLRKTLSSFAGRWKSPFGVFTGTYCSNNNCTIDVVRKLAPSASIAAEFEHNGEKKESTIRVGSQVDFIGQSSVRIGVDPSLKVKAMVSGSVGRTSMLQLVFHWDPTSRTFRQGIELKVGGAVPV